MPKNPFENSGPRNLGMEMPKHEQPAKLFLGNLEFIGTFNTREQAEKYRKLYGGQIKDFGVKINTIDPETQEALEWEEDQEGFSLWRTIGK